MITLDMMLGFYYVSMEQYAELKIVGASLLVCCLIIMGDYIISSEINVRKYKVKVDDV